MTSDSSTDKTEQILDLLLDLLEQRRGTRATEAVASPPPEPVEPVRPRAAYSQPRIVNEHVINAPPPPPPAAVEIAAEAAPVVARPVFVGSGSEMPRTIWRMVAVILLFVVLAQVPIDFAWLNQMVGAAGDDGTETVLLSRDGMLLRGSGLPVYVIEGDRRRWITTAEAFDEFGYRWAAVRPVTDSYLEQFAEAAPIYLLLKCSDTPHIFALDVRQKGDTDRVRRWIKDIPTFEALGFDWSQVDETRCGFLRSLPDGVPFPADAGRPPLP